MIPFADHAAKLENEIERAYGIRIITRDVPDPLTGDLDGAEIHVDYLLTPEQRLFLLAHLFGHTAQWNLSQEGFELGQAQTPPVPEPRVDALIQYEREAARFALALMHQVGIADADQWFSDYAACDEAYLRHYYLTGEKRDFLSFWEEGTPLVEPEPAPPFTPSVHKLRADGIVI